MPSLGQTCDSGVMGILVIYDQLTLDGIDARDGDSELTIEIRSGNFVHKDRHRMSHVIIYRLVPH